MERSASGVLGSACVPRAGFGVTPKQAFVVGCCTMRLLPRGKVRDRETQSPARTIGGHGDRGDPADMPDLRRGRRNERRGAAGASSLSEMRRTGSGGTDV